MELINRVKDLPPHDTKKTLSLNETRNIILILNKPIAEMIQVIDNNKRLVETVQSDIDGIKEDINELKKREKFKRFDIELEDLAHPATVCAHNKCKRFVEGWETQATNMVYDQFCHDHCTIKGITTETINDPRLAHCNAFDFDTS